MSDERFKIPDRYGDEPGHMAIIARLKALSERETIGRVRVVYWRDGDEMPLMSHIFSSGALFNVRRFAPIEATHLTIEEP
jgi:hypothetical protein